MFRNANANLLKVLAIILTLAVGSAVRADEVWNMATAWVVVQF